MKTADESLEPGFFHDDIVGGPVFLQAQAVEELKQQFDDLPCGNRTLRFDVGSDDQAGEFDAIDGFDLRLSGIGQKAGELVV